MDLETRRQFFAEEIAAVANLHTPELIAALARVPREAFLRPGPWLVQGEFTGGPRWTPDADPRHVYHNYSVAIEPEQQLFNGSPSFLSSIIDALEVKRGNAVLHIGAGLGYYSAMLGYLVGDTGRVVAIEVDATLAASARQNLRSMPWVDVQHGDGQGPFDQTFDAILVNAGVTHPHASWLDHLAPGGRLLLPLTAAMPAMGPIGKGFTVLVTRTSDVDFAARSLSMTAIYSAIGLRDEALNAELGKAMMRNPRAPVTRLRRDVHAPGPSCWLHGSGFCFATD